MEVLFMLIHVFMMALTALITFISVMLSEPGRKFRVFIVQPILAGITTAYFITKINSKFYIVAVNWLNAHLATDNPNGWVKMEEFWYVIISAGFFIGLIILVLQIFFAIVGIYTIISSGLSLYMIVMVRVGMPMPGEPFDLSFSNALDYQRGFATVLIVLLVIRILWLLYWYTAGYGFSKLDVVYLFRMAKMTAEEKAHQKEVEAAAKAKQEELTAFLRKKEDLKSTMSKEQYAAAQEIIAEEEKRKKEEAKNSLTPEQIAAAREIYKMEHPE